MLLLLCSANPAVAGRKYPGGRCSTNTTSLSTVIIGNVNKVPDINSFLSFSCSGVKPPAAGRRIVYCWHIHGGAYTSRFDYREAKFDRNTIRFNFYARDWDGGTKKVGSAREPYNIIGIADMPVSNGKTNTYNIKTPFTLRFEGNSSVTPSDGTYTYQAGGTHFLLSDIGENDELNYRNACKNTNGDITGQPQSISNIPLNISVKTYCNVKVSKHLLFPKQIKLDKSITADATVTVDCSAGTDYQVKIDNGLNHSGKMRRMKRLSGDDMIAYSISPENWKGIGVGTPQGEDFTIDGTVPQQETPPVGIYQDTLVVTVSIDR